MRNTDGSIITKNHHYCDKHRAITLHVPRGWNIVCVNAAEHRKIRWCSICGQRKDTSECKHNWHWRGKVKVFEK